MSTDKVDSEVPSPFCRRPLEILVPEDEITEVGNEIARIGDASGARPLAAFCRRPASGAARLLFCHRASLRAPRYACSAFYGESVSPEGTVSPRG